VVSRSDLIAGQNSQLRSACLAAGRYRATAATASPLECLLPGGILLQHIGTSTEAFSIAVDTVQQTLEH